MICICFKYFCGKLCRMLIDEYFFFFNMYLVISLYYNYLVRFIFENRLMVLELVIGQISNQFSSFNRNIIQICLYLEGIGMFVKVRFFCMILKKYFRILKCFRVKKVYYYVFFKESIVVFFGYRFVFFVFMYIVNVLLFKFICIFLVDRNMYMYQLLKV